mgnify:CR=1 FL=1
MNFTRVVKVTTAETNSELLQENAVKEAIKSCLGLDEKSYQDRLLGQPTKELIGFKMKLDIISDVETKFDINGQAQDLIYGVAYSTNYSVKIYSIKMHAAGTVTLVLDIKK